MSAVNAPRIPPGDRRQVGALGWIVAAVGGRVARTRPLHLFLTLGRHRRLFRAWLLFAGRLMPGGTLPRRDTELVILRVAHLCGCDYEFEHHVVLSRRAGVRPPDVERITVGPAAPGWSPRERAILAAVEELHHQRDIGDETWTELRNHLDERGAIELCFLVGNYEMLATTITTLRVQPDEPRRRKAATGG